MENRKKCEEPKLSQEMGVKFLCLQFEYPIHCNLSWKTIKLGKLSRFESKVFLLTMCLFLRPQFSNSLKFWNLSFPNISFLFMKRKPKIQEFVLSMACTRVRNCWALPKDAFSKKEYFARIFRILHERIEYFEALLSPALPIQQGAENCQFAAKISPLCVIKF